MPRWSRSLVKFELILAEFPKEGANPVQRTSWKEQCFPDGFKTIGWRDLFSISMIRGQLQRQVPETLWTAQAESLKLPPYELLFAEFS